MSAQPRKGPVANPTVAYALGVDAERFIAAMHREPFDYTRWKGDQWQDATVAGLAEQARVLRARVATPD